MDIRDIPVEQSNGAAPLAQPYEPPTARAGWATLLSGANGVRSLALVGGVGLHAINTFLATTILPSVVKDIGGLNLYAWSTTVYVAASILGSALAARLLQRTNPRSAYAIAATIFALGAMICALAPTMPVLLIGRCVQGFGGGLLIALAYVMIRLLFEEALWPRAVALISGVWGIMTLIGPAAGGLFAQYGIWRVAFWTLVPLAILFATLAACILPKDHAVPERRPSLPVLQIVLLIAAVLAVSAASTHTGVLQNLAGIGVGAGLIAILVRVECRSARRLLPHGIFQPGTIISALYATTALLVTTACSSDIFMPLFLQTLHHQSPLAAGYLAAIMSAGWSLGSVGGSGITGRNVGRIIVAGPLLQLVCMIALALLMPGGSRGTWAELAPLCLAIGGIGLGIGMTWPHLMTRLLKAVDPAEQDLAGGSITTVQLFSMAMASAFAGMVANAGGLVDPGGLAGAAEAARWLFGVFAFAPLLSSLTALRAVRS